MAQEGREFEFADGKYLFKLTLAGINEIQSKCGVGIGKVWSRLAHSRLNYLDEDVGIPQDAQFHIEDIIEPIRQGLLGGGSGEADGKEVKVNSFVANRLIENYVITRPLQEGWSLAYALVGALIEGYDPPIVKKNVTDDTSETARE